MEYLILVNPQAGISRHFTEPQEPGVTEVTCPIAAIQECLSLWHSSCEDIYSMAEDGSSCFPPEVIKALEPEELFKTYVGKKR